MHFRTAIDTYEPTVLPANVVPLNRPAASRERTYIEQKIAAKEAEIGKLAGEIRWLKMELETV